jgi:hypothetical protein
MVRSCLGLYLAVVALSFSWGLSTAAGAQEMNQAYIRMNVSSYEEFAEAIDWFEDNGALIRHRFYPIAVMGLIEDGTMGAIGTAPGVRRVFVGKIPADEIVGLQDKEAFLMKAYNNVFFAPMSGQPRDYSAPEVEGTPIDPGPISIPEQYREEYLADMRRPRQGAPGVPPPFPEATSEYMLGDIAVAAILPESEPGFGNHNWTRDEEEKTTEEILSAMDWWARHSPNQELTFSYEMNYAVPVAYEPSSNPQVGGESAWAGQCFAALGYEGTNYFVQARDYINAMRQSYDADWGFVIFVIHGFPGQQFGGALAYAYLGGPLNVNIYSNGYIGPDSLDRVIAHESGHIFYTLDEYPQAPSSCSSRSGYLNVENANKQQGGAYCQSDVPCVMRGGSQPTPFDILEPCYFTEGQVGWWDSDGDVIPNILDTLPKVDGLVLETPHLGGGVSADTVLADAVTYRGTVSSVAYPNMNPQSLLGGKGVTVEPVGAEYRVDGGPWEPCDPGDGRFDGTPESFELTLSGLTLWEVHRVQVRAITAHGNATRDAAAATASVVLGEPPPFLIASSPAKPPLSIKFEPPQSPAEVGKAVNVEVAIYDLVGRKIKTVESGVFQTGRLYVASWDGKDLDGNLVVAGVYAITMSSQGQVKARKVLVIP